MAKNNNATNNNSINNNATSSMVMHRARIRHLTRQQAKIQTQMHLRIKRAHLMQAETKATTIKRTARDGECDHFPSLLICGIS